MVSFAIKNDTAKYALIQFRTEMMLKCQRNPGVFEETNVACIGEIPKITPNTV